MLARIDESVCLKEIGLPVLDDGLKDFSWDGAQADVSAVPHVREETLFGDGSNVRRPKVQGQLCRGQSSI